MRRRGGFKAHARYPLGNPARLDPVLKYEMTKTPEPPSTPRSGRIINLLFLLVLAWLASPAIKGLYYKHLAPAVPVEDSLAWRDSLSTAMTDSAQTSKPILLVFTASWCPPCQAMKHEVWTDPAVRELAESRYVPVLLDIDRPESRPAVGHYGVSSIPTIIVLNQKGDVARRASSMGVNATLEFLQDR